ncbi:MAG: hypothetical protein ACI9OJ_003284 [Myxococcota bacterium]|jgi:hypothetical protein
MGGAGSIQRKPQWPHRHCSASLSRGKRSDGRLLTRKHGATEWVRAPQMGQIEVATIVLSAI